MYNKTQSKFQSHLLSLRAVSRTRAGGRQRRFAAMVIIGDGEGNVGYGTGKSANAGDAIKKAEKNAQNHLIFVPIRSGSIPYNVQHKHCATTIKLNRACGGTGLNTNGVTRKICELAGLKEIKSKCIGNSTSQNNIVFATMEALKKLDTLGNLAKRLNKSVEDLMLRRTFKKKSEAQHVQKA